MSWPTMRAAIQYATASFEQSDAEEDLDYYVRVKIHFAGHHQGQVVQGSFQRSVSVGLDRPSPTVVEEKKQEILQKYRSELIVHVNPKNPRETMVEPSLSNAFLLLGIGTLLSLPVIFALWKAIKVTFTWLRELL